MTCEAVVVNLIGAGHHCDAKAGHQICNAAMRSTMAAPFARSPSRSTRGTTIEISAATESHRHHNRGYESAPSPDLIEPEDPNREPQSRIQIFAARTKKSFSRSWFLVSSSCLLVVHRSGADDGLQ